MKNKIFITFLTMMLQAFIIGPVFAAETGKNLKGLGDLLAQQFGFGKNSMALAQAHQFADGANWDFTFVRSDGTSEGWVFKKGQFAKARFMPRIKTAYTANDYFKMKQSNPKIIDELNRGARKIVFKGTLYESTYTDPAGHVKTKSFK